MKKIIPFTLFILSFWLSKAIPCTGNAGPDQSVCRYSLVTLAAHGGSGTWTALASNPTAVTFSNANDSSATARGFTVGGSYFLVWTGSGCADTVKITVKAPNAGTDQSVCKYSLVTLAAHGGSGTWSTLASNPDSIIITNPSDSSSTASGFVGVGPDYLVWTSNGCTDTVKISILAPNAGPDQGICIRGTITMAAVGTGNWTKLSTNPVNVTITNVSLINTAVRGFTAYGQYGFVWNSGGCTDTMYVSVTPKPDAGPDTSVCQGLPVTLSGVSTGVWSAQSNNPTASVIDSPTFNHTRVTGLVNTGVYQYIWSDHGCTDTMKVSVTISPNAGPDITVCQYSPITMAANGTTGSGFWTASPSNPTFATFANATNPVSTATGFNQTGIYTFIWSLGTCTPDTMKVTVTAKPNAGPDTIVCQNFPITLQGTGTGVWSAIATNPAVVSFAANTSPTSGLTGLTTAGVYYLKWAQGGCTDTTMITVTLRPNAGADRTICQYSSPALAGNGTIGTWTGAPSNPAVVSFSNYTVPNAIATGFTQSGTYILIWSLGTCSPDSVIFTVKAKPNAGPDIIVCQHDTAILAGIDTGRWTIQAGNPGTSTIAALTSPTSIVTGLNTIGQYHYIWTAGGCTDTTNVNVSPVANAGPDISICSRTNITMAGNGTAGVWRELPTNPNTVTFVDSTLPQTGVSGFNVAGRYGFVWNIGTCGVDTMYVTVFFKPNAGNDNGVACFTTGVITLGAVDSPGVWTAWAGNPAAVSIHHNTWRNAVIDSFQGAGTYYFIYTNGVCSDTVKETVNSACICPGVTAGTTTGPGDTVIDCNANSCYTLKAQHIDFGTTNTYAVNRIPYTPYRYTGGTAVSVHIDDVWSDTVPMPFKFCFFGNLYDKFWIGSNGLITFTYPGPPNSYCTWPLAPGTAYPNTNWTTNCIMGPYQDIDPSVNRPWIGSINWQQIDTYPCRKMIINIDHIPYFSCNDSQATSQIVLYETSNVIDINIQHKTTCIGWNSGYAVEGIENSAGTAAYIVPGRNNGQIWNASNDAWRFTPNGPSLVRVDWWEGSTHLTNKDTITICIPRDSFNIVRHVYQARALYLRCAGDTVFEADSVHVTTLPISTAGPDFRIACFTGHDTAILNAARRVGRWTIQPGNPGNSVIAHTDSMTTMVTGFTAVGTYKYIYTAGTCSDTAYVIISNSPDAGPNQSICLSSGRATMAAAGTFGVWTGLPANPPGAIISNINSPTTTITNMTQAGGVYRFVWTVNNVCTDTVKITVLNNPNAGSDQVICQYTTATMAAIGTGTWTADSSNPAPTVITTPSSATSSITGFTSSGTYHFIWTTGFCSDTMSVFVTPKPDAGTDQTICQYTSTTMTAIGTAGQWTAISTNPTSTTFTASTSPTTTINGFSLSGVYKYVWTVSGCTDTMIVNVTAKPSAGSDLIICQYTSATMAATGSGIWTALSTNPAVTTISDTTLSSTNITGFTSSGTYGFVWTVNGCTDTINVYVTPKPSAGPDQTICQYTANLATTAASGVGSWSAQASNPGSTTFGNASQAVTTISGFGPFGAYYYVWTSNSCTDTMIINVTAKPDAGSDQTICQYTSATMAGVGSGTWSALSSNPATATITTPSSNNTTVTDFTASGIYHFVWTVNGCTDTMSVFVTAKPNAGPDQTICQYAIATMAGAGTGTWSALSTNPVATNITTPTQNNTTITGFSVLGTYGFVWTVNGCTDTVTIVTAKPNAGADQTVCQYTSATMAANGTSGLWTAFATNPSATTFTASTSPATTINGFNTVGVYSFVWSFAGCTDTMSVTVTAKPNAGIDQTICQYTPTTMAGVGSGIWSAVPTNPAIATIATPTSNITSITNFTSSGIYQFVWTVNGCTDTMIVNVTAKPDAGADQTICQYTTASTSAVGTGSWTAISTNPAATSFSNASLAATTISGFTLPGAYSYVWTSNSCTDTMIVHVTAKPDAGTDQTICQYTSTTMLTGVGTGVWSAVPTNPAVTNIVSPSSNNTSITNFTSSGTYQFVWTVNGCTDTMIVNVTAKPDAGTDQTVCEYSVATLAGVGTGIWSSLSTNPIATNITTPSQNSTTITGFSTMGTFNYVWTVNGCTDTMAIAIAKPNAGTDQTICQNTSATMAAGGASGLWSAFASNPAATTFTSASSPTTIINGFTASGAYTFVWTLNGCTDTMIVNVTAKPNAGPDVTICQFTLDTLAGIGTGTWSALTGPAVVTITNPSLANSTVSGFAIAGSYPMQWSVNGCTDTMLINVTTQPTAALRDTAICIGMSAILSPTVVPTGGTFIWNTGANTNTITVNPTVNTGYSFTYTLGICIATAADSVRINPLPVITVPTIPSICTANNGIASATVTVGSPTFHYSWTAAGAGDNDTAYGLAPGPYTVTVTDANGCQNTASGTVAVINPGLTVTELSQHNLKCFGDGTGAINISVTDTAPRTLTYTYTYAWSNTAVTQNISGLAAGPYSVLVTDQYGCTGTLSETVTQPTALQLTLPTHTNPICFGYSNGTAGFTATGGSGAYSYSWNTTPVQNASTATGLPSGVYILTAHDDSACVAIDSITLTDPLAITFAPSLTIMPSCFGGSDGSAQVYPQHGIGTYTYLWSDPNHQITDSATGLSAATYTVTATDQNGCTGTTTLTINQPSPVLVSITPTDATCYGYSNGSAVAAGSGGIPGYTYLWSNNNQTGPNAINLPTGPISVVCTDSKGCTATDTKTIGQPTPVAVSLTTVRVNCPGSLDGTITATGHGGTGTLAYTLYDANGTKLDSNATGSFTTVGAGLHTVIATDQNGCTASASITVPQAPFNSYSSRSDSTSCFGSDYHDGRIHLQGYTIENGPFMYSVDNSPYQYTPEFFDLAAGSHLVHARDRFGCDTSFTVVVHEPSPASVQILPGDVTIVPGQTVQLSTIFGPYSTSSIISYSWSPSTGLSCIDCPNPIVSPYSDIETYTLVVTYSRGCLTSSTIRISTQGDPPLYIPNGFSPNGDGNNDEFLVFGTGIKDIQINIFNRWGEKIFESDNQSVGWDGTYLGQLQPPGVYVVTVDLVYLNGKKRSKHGSLTLIR